MEKNVRKPAAAGPSGEVRAAELLYKLALKKAKAAGDAAQRCRKKMKAAKKAAKRAKRAYRLAKRELAMAEQPFANAKASLPTPVRPAPAPAAKSGYAVASRPPMRKRKPIAKSVAAKKAKKPVPACKAKKSRKLHQSAVPGSAKSLAPVAPPAQEQPSPPAPSPEPNGVPSPS